MSCKRCGKCCKSVFFALKDVPIGEDNREIRKWAEYHGVNVMKYGIEGKDYLAINIDKECIFLVDEGNGFTSCAIHGKHPQVCKDYFCKDSND